MSPEGEPLSNKTKPQSPQSFPIVPEFKGRHTNLFSYPDRGPWGDASYPGNFSGKLVLDLVDLYKARSVADPFAGGGTTEAVCKEFGISYWAEDLRDGFNILEDAIPPCSDGSSPELVMFHPPYFDLIEYSGRVWGGEPHPADLSAAPTLDDFIRMANEAEYAAYTHIRQGGHVAILIGSIRREGVLYPLHRMMNLYGKLDIDGVKVQFNTTGARTPHPARNIALLVTEWVMVLEKPHAWIVPVRVTNPPKEYDMRHSDRQTWRSIVLSVLESGGNSGTLEDIYAGIKSHVRVSDAEAQGIDWRAIVRRELQAGPFRSQERGVWELASPQPQKVDEPDTPTSGANQSSSRAESTKVDGSTLQKATPLFRQYSDIKQQFPDAILLFRLGDFYEMFGEDAERVARELDIVLTSRNISKSRRIPMAGIPHHAAESYIARLIEKGYHVAVCEQTGGEPINGLIPREVVKVVTPGLTNPEASLSDVTQDNEDSETSASKHRPTWAEMQQRAQEVEPDGDLEEGEFGAHEI